MEGGRGCATSSGIGAIWWPGSAVCCHAVGWGCGGYLSGPHIGCWPFSLLPALQTPTLQFNWFFCMLVICNVLSCRSFGQIGAWEWIRFGGDWACIQVSLFMGGPIRGLGVKHLVTCPGGAYRLASTYVAGGNHREACAQVIPTNLSLCSSSQALCWGGIRWQVGHLIFDPFQYCSITPLPLILLMKAVALFLQIAICCVLVTPPPLFSSLARNIAVTDRGDLRF